LDPDSKEEFISIPITSIPPIHIDWHYEARASPSQDNNIIYRAIKEQILVTGGNLREYTDSPVYYLRGCSNVWGLYSLSL
jgi:hypothetical protein